MEFNIYRLSGDGKYYYNGCEDHANEVCSKAFYNNSEGQYPFSSKIDSIQDLIALVDEVGSIIFDGEGEPIKIYDDYNE